MKSKKWIFVLCSFLASFFLVACQSGSNGSQSAVEAIKQKGEISCGDQSRLCTL